MFFYLSILKSILFKSIWGSSLSMRGDHTDQANGDHTDGGSEVHPVGCSSHWSDAGVRIPPEAFSRERRGLPWWNPSKPDPAASRGELKQEVRVFRWFSKRRNVNRHARRRNVRLQQQQYQGFESLEGRVLMSVSSGFDATTGALTVTSNAADSISINVSAGFVKVNGANPGGIAVQP